MSTRALLCRWRALHQYEKPAQLYSAISMGVFNFIENQSTNSIESIEKNFLKRYKSGPKYTKAQSSFLSQCVVTASGLLQVWAQRKNPIDWTPTKNHIVFTFFCLLALWMQSFVQFKTDTALPVFLLSLLSFNLDGRLNALFFSLFISFFHSQMDRAIKIKQIWQFSHSYGWKMALTFSLWTKKSRFDVNLHAKHNEQDIVQSKNLSFESNLFGLNAVDARFDLQHIENYENV